MEEQALLEPFEKMLDLLVGKSSAHQQQEILASGYLDALVAEAAGGAGLTLGDIGPLLIATGYHGVDFPLGLTMAARGLGLGDDFRAVPRPLTAVIAAAQIAGAAARVLDMTIAFANERVQFGKPIAKQQVIQHQLAVMGEQVLMARMASQIGCSAGMAPPLEIAAIAKNVASAAVPIIAAIAHGVHGAIGITAEFDLQRFTKNMHNLRIEAGAESYWARQLGDARIASGPMPSLDFVRTVADPMFQG